MQFGLVPAGEVTERVIPRAVVCRLLDWRELFTHIHLECDFPIDVVEGGQVHQEYALWYGQYHFRIVLENVA